MTAVVPAGTRTGAVTVTTATTDGTGTASGTSTDAFRINSGQPTITSFTPTSATPGVSDATITITGTNFTGATGVMFGSATATTYTVVSSTSITASVRGGSRTGSITVTGADGSLGTSTASFTVLYPPLINSITGSPGKAGAAVTLNGYYFTGATSVKFNGTTAAFMVVSDNSITTTVPSGAASGTITVTAADGTGTSTQTFTVAP